MQQSQEGIVNFYNEKDVALLGIGTTILGNVDGGRGPSAGRVGLSRGRDEQGLRGDGPDRIVQGAGRRLGGAAPSSAGYLRTVGHPRNSSGEVIRRACRGCSACK